MQIFINETTLQGQYTNRINFEKAIISILSILKKISSLSFQKEFFTDKSRLSSYYPISDQIFHECLKTIDKSLCYQFKRFIFDRVNIKDWRAEQKHSLNNSYSYLENHPATDTSVAELAERKLLRMDLICSLINFQKSNVQDIQLLEIIKNGEDDVNLVCIESNDQLNAWISTILLNQYDTTSNLSPTDNQTILRDINKFVMTNYIQQGRKVYREIRTNFLWHVDKLHYGNSVHLEVFDRFGHHYGEANLNGAIDITKKDRSKRLSIH